MAQATFTLQVAGSIDDVFDTLADMTRLKEADPDIRTAVQTTDGAIGVGTRFQMQVRQMGTMRMEITEHEPPNHLRHFTQGAMAKVDGDIRFSTDADKVRIDWAIDMKGRGFGLLLTPFLGMFMKRGIRQTIENYKRYFEERAKSKDA